MNSIRYLKPFITKYLPEKMVLLAGPRQVGKTTLALSCSPGHAGADYPGYLNWDDVKSRKSLLRGEVPIQNGLLILDEIHKYARWRTLVKGLFDTKRQHMQFIITGSARLDHYRKGGDSLAGRYFLARLHPFSFAELGYKNLDALLRFGGFPEPLLRGEEEFHRLWQRQLKQRIVREDLRDLETVKEISLIEHLVEMLPRRVGAPLSIKSLREDLGVAHETVARWLKILENLFLIFTISPYGSPKFRAVKKEQKCYFWDWSHVAASGPRFENLVAAQLLKYCHFVEDTRGFAMELRFIRDIDRREIDFVVLRDGHAEFAVECKTGEQHISPRIGYFKERTAIPRFYQVHLGSRDYVDAKSGGRVLPFATFCQELGMP
jgi:predicted AAA+ superfamily ATPase